MREVRIQERIICRQEKELRACGMDQWGKVLATKPENLSSINPFHVALERQAGHVVLEQVRKDP